MNAGPVPSSEHVRARLQRQRIRDTAPEMALRRELHARGLRYRVDFPPLSALRRRADIVFTRVRVAVFVDGCFWHGCPECGLRPRANGPWWADKLAGNRSRDDDTDRRLREAGWTVVRVWEHQDVAEAATGIVAIVRTASSRGCCPEPAPLPAAATSF